MTAGTLRVAPREVVDLVWRASRVRGCDPALADRVAADVAYCELHNGGGLAAWLDLADGEPGLLAESARAAHLVAVAEVGATDDGAGDCLFDPPLPFALVARAINEATGRGVHSDVPLDGLAGTDRLDRLDLISDGRTGHGTADHRARHRAALAAGLDVDQAAWTRLVVIAQGFLVSEADLDAEGATSGDPTNATRA